MMRLVVFGLVAVAIDRVLLHAAQRYDVSMALLSGGGGISIALLSLGAMTLLTRLFVRLVLPGLVVFELLRPRR